MKYMLYLLFLFSIVSCSRGYFDSKEVPYDYPTAYKLCQEFHEGLMVIQVPTAAKKLQILEQRYLSEVDLEKKEKKRSIFESERDALKKAQISLLQGAHKWYDFNQVVCIPDTLIKEFRAGVRNNIFLKSDLKFHPVRINSTGPILYIRSGRDYDDLRIYNENNRHPHQPFPSTSTANTSEIGYLNLKDRENKMESNKIYIAIYMLNQKLKRLYAATPPAEKT